MNVNKYANLSRLTKRDEAFYLEHVRAIKHVRTLVDNKAPLVVRSTMLPNKRKEISRMKKIVKSNENLIKRINVIYRTKGQIDSYLNVGAGHNTACSYYMKHLLEKVEQIESSNREVYEKLNSKKSIININGIEKRWRTNLAKIQEKCRYPYVMSRRKPDEENISALLYSGQKRTKMFFEFTVENGITLGRVKVFLFNDIIPKLVDNFLSNLHLIQFNEEEKKSRDRKGNTISMNKIFTNLYAEFTVPVNDSTDSYLQRLEPIDHAMPFNCSGALAMIPSDGNFLSGKYVLTFKPLSTLNGVFAAFGQIYHGWHVLEALEGWGRKFGAPIRNIYISNCGVLSNDQF